MCDKAVAPTTYNPVLPTGRGRVADPVPRESRNEHSAKHQDFPGRCTVRFAAIAGTVILAVTGLTTLAPVATSAPVAAVASVTSTWPVQPGRPAWPGHRFPIPPIPRNTPGRTIPVGDGPSDSAFDPLTHTLYVTNFNAASVSVIDTSRCNALSDLDCVQPLATVQLGTGASPDSLVVDVVTDTIYVSNGNGSSVAVIAGARCNAGNTSGCGQNPPAVGVGKGNFPLALDVNDLTNTVYVANYPTASGPSTLSVIDGATCDAGVTSGCGQSAGQVTLAATPFSVTVDPSTDSVYATTIDTNGDEAVSVVNGATCNGTTTSGCDRTPVSVALGAGGVDSFLSAINPSTETLYVLNAGNNTVSMIDTASCNAEVTSRCGAVPPVANVGNGPTDVAVDAVTNTVYVTNSGDDTVSLLDAATCNATVTSGCDQQPTRLLRTGLGPQAISVDPATDTLYVTNGEDDTESVLNGAGCNSAAGWGCTRYPLTVAIPNAASPSALAVDPATDTLYVANPAGTTVSVLNAFDGQTVATVTVGEGPYRLTVNPDNNTVYVPTNIGISLINAATCNATVTSGCGQAPDITMSGTPQAAAVDKATDSIYVSNQAGMISVFNGTTCNATITTGCATPTTVTVGDYSIEDVAVDQRTNTVYTADSDLAGGAAETAATVSVIDGATCNGTVATGCGATPPTITVGAEPGSLAVDEATDTIYVANTNPAGPNGTVSLVNGAICNADVTSGCNQIPPTVNVGRFPKGIALDQTSAGVYVTNGEDNTVSVFDGNRCNAIDDVGCPLTPVTVPTLLFPWAVAVNQATHAVYVTDPAAGTIMFLGAIGPYGLS
jgi:YVTN family beta-propeller protein